MAGSYYDIDVDQLVGGGGGTRWGARSGDDNRQPADNPDQGRDITSLVTGSAPAPVLNTDLTALITGGTANRATAGVGAEQQQIMDIYNMIGGNTLAQTYGAQNNALLAQQALTSQIYGIDANALQTNSDLALRGLGLDREGLAIDQGAAVRDLGSIDKLLGINERSYNRTVASVANLLGLNDKDLANQLAKIGLQEDMSNRDWRDDAAARGAYGAPGTRRKFTDIERTAELGRIAAQIGHAGTSQSLRDRQGNALDAYDTTKLSLQDRRAGVYDTMSRIDLAGKRLDLSAEQINASLQQGLDRLGITHLTDINELMKMINSNNIEQQTMAATLLAQAAQLAGLDLFGDLGGGGTSGGWTTPVSGAH